MDDGYANHRQKVLILRWVPTSRIGRHAKKVSDQNMWG